MKYTLKCLTNDNGEIDLKISAESEEDAEAIALVNDEIKEVITITPMNKERLNNLTYNSMKRKDYPYIKNTGKSTVRIYS
jgi:hypothetical protein